MRQATVRRGLISFEVENYRSYLGPARLELEATGMADDRFVRTAVNGERLLPAAALFGANASGKSNVLAAMSELRSHVVTSFQHRNPSGLVPHEPFRLNEESLQAPTRFAICFLNNGARYRYDVCLETKGVQEEVLHRCEESENILLFRRSGNGIEESADWLERGPTAGQFLRANALYLSTAAAANHSLAMEIQIWFMANLRFANLENAADRRLYVAHRATNDAAYRQRVVALLASADLGINDLQLSQEKASESYRRFLAKSGLAPEYVNEPATDGEMFRLQMKHAGRDGSVMLEEDDESTGTLTWLGHLGPVLDALDDGMVLLVDELGSGMHPDLVALLIGMFQDPESNPNGGQLVFTTHDTTLLGDSQHGRPLGRDQVWFTEKNEFGESALFPLRDFSPRQESSIQRRYLQGRYGALPVVNDSDVRTALNERIADHG